jgi:hypothetical protein
MNILRFPVLFSCALALTGTALKADLVYHLPFDNGTTATLDNGGTAGGTATNVASLYGIVSAPTASTSPVKFGSHSEFYTTNPANTVYGGATLLPNSTTNFRLDNATSQMTLSTWVYWNGAAGTNNRYGIANLFPSNNAAGWSLAIDNTGKLIYAFQAADVNLGRSRTTTSAVITTGTWINVTLTVDTSITSSAAVAMYVNGVQQSLTGASLTTAVTVSNPGDIAVGLYNHTNGAAGSFALNGYMDDFAMWDTALSAAQIKAVSTTPAVLTGYNAGVMNGLFNTYASQGSSIVGSLTWTYATGFDTTSRTVGDTWLGTDGKYYLWLDGASNNALGLMGVASNIPEPGTYSILLGASALAFVACRRSRRQLR